MSFQKSWYFAFDYFLTHLCCWVHLFQRSCEILCSKDSAIHSLEQRGGSGHQPGRNRSNCTLLHTDGLQVRFTTSILPTSMCSLTHKPSATLTSLSFYSYYSYMHLRINLYLPKVGSLSIDALFRQRAASCSNSRMPSHLGAAQYKPPSYTTERLCQGSRGLNALLKDTSVVGRRGKILGDIACRQPIASRHCLLV